MFLLSRFTTINVDFSTWCLTPGVILQQSKARMILFFPKSLTLCQHLSLSPYPMTLLKDFSALCLSLKPNFGISLQFKCIAIVDSILRVWYSLQRDMCHHGNSSWDAYLILHVHLRPQVQSTRLRQNNLLPTNQVFVPSLAYKTRSNVMLASVWNNVKKCPNFV